MLHLTTQSEQGRQYGQSGFVGEPINLNVVNADIRDILNYITEQYGVNFIIDSSVGAVPVTVNVQDVPWNIALDAILKANRLGIEVSGNILRVATTSVLATEAGTQRVINESRLDASPLVTEFIRLNYARASGSLQSTAGAAGGFAGGQAAGATSAASTNAPGDVRGQGAIVFGDQSILPIIQRRLSKRGGIEVDQRSNTIIVTDVAGEHRGRSSIVALLDQPEPQVEIETRIVIGNRNFQSRSGSSTFSCCSQFGAWRSRLGQQFTWRTNGPPTTGRIKFPGYAIRNSCRTPWWAPFHLLLALS